MLIYFYVSQAFLAGWASMQCCGRWWAGQDMTCRVILQVRQRTWSNIIIRSAGRRAAPIQSASVHASDYTHQQGSASCDTDSRRGSVRLCGWWWWWGCLVVTLKVMKQRDVGFNNLKPSDDKTWLNSVFPEDAGNLLQNDVSPAYQTSADKRLQLNAVIIPMMQSRIYTTCKHLEPFRKIWSWLCSLISSLPSIIIIVRHYSILYCKNFWVTRPAVDSRPATWQRLWCGTCLRRRHKNS